MVVPSVAEAFIQYLIVVEVSRRRYPSWARLGPDLAPSWARLGYDGCIGCAEGTGAADEGDVARTISEPGIKNRPPSVRKYPGMSTPDPIDRFLQQEVASASPAKLHWLLLCRAHSLSVTISNLWDKGDHQGAQQWIILVREILTELLAGIVDATHPLARQQSDLYIFLSALLATAEQGRDTAALKDLCEILEIEMISWEMLVQRESLGGGATAAPVDGHNANFDFSA